MLGPHRSWSPVVLFIIWSIQNSKTLRNAPRPRGLSRSYTNLDQISSSESRPKNQFLNQTSASPINLKFKISTKHSFRIATKIQLHNLYKTSASKCWTNSSFKILPELQLQSLDQPLCSKSESLVLGPNVSFQICQHDLHYQHQQQ